MNRIIRVLKHPKQLKTSINLRLRRRKIDKIYNNTKRENSELFKDIAVALSHFHSGGGYVRNMQDYKVYQLYNLLLKKRPKLTLEIGSGSSSYAFIRYASEFKDVKHTVVDESNKWLQNTKTTIEKLGLETERVTWQKGTKSISQKEAYAEISLEEEFKKAYDFVFIDGPTLQINGVQDSRHINTDIFKIYDFSPPKSIIVDIRMYTVQEINNRLGRFYSCNESHLFNLASKRVDQEFNYFSVFELVSENNN